MFANVPQQILVSVLMTDLYQALHCTCYVLAIRAELCCGNCCFEAEMVQQHLRLPVDQQSLPLCVYSEQKQSVRADTEGSELSQALEWEC